MSDAAVPRLNAALEGRYRILDELGEGGMAKVYLADDLKHERKVAVKVLRPELAALIGGERFLAEIKTTAALQHPHILPLFDSGEADGFLYYVMPYVDGESLRAYLDRERQLDVADAVRIAKAVGSALEYAHERDIIHRDIKPENILLHAGQPVVADFGIALAISAAGGGRLTETGLSLGTPHYMSPEQASADRELSARSDVYSLGCMVYEMLAGQPPHTGPTAQSVLVRILTEEARPLTELRRTVPPHVAAAVTKSIEKLPADRFKSAQEFVDALHNEGFRWDPVHTRGATTGPRPARAEAERAGSRPWDTRSKALAGLAGFLAVVVAVQGFRAVSVGSEAPAAPVVSFLLQDSADLIALPAVGSDGSTAIVRQGVVYVRPPGALTEQALGGTSSVSNATFSPDAGWIAYTDGDPPRTLKKIPATGGPVVTLWSYDGEGQLLIPTWGEDGWIYFAILGPEPALSRVPEVGGPAETVFELAASAAFTADVLPGGRAIVFGLSTAVGQQGRVVALDLSSGDTATVVPDGFSPRWSPTGHLVYAHASGALFAVPFDPREARPTGLPVPVLDGLGVFGAVVGRYDLSRSGTLAYIRAPAVGTGDDFSFTLVGPNGGVESLPLDATDHWDAGFSPNGRLMAYTREDQIWVYDLDLGSNRQLTTAGSGHHNPRWSPEGTEIAFRATSDSVAGIWIVPATGGEPRLVARGPDYNPAQWLADGSILVSTDAGDIGRTTASGGEVTWIFEADWIESGPAVSPDGRWIAYQSDEGGAMALYVRSWPDLANKIQVSQEGLPLERFSYPLWAPGGRSLLYHQGPSVVEATLDPSDGLRVTGHRSLPSSLGGFYLSTIHPDGRVLAMTMGEIDDSADGLTAQLIVVTNWFTELRSRLTGGGFAGR